MNTVTPKYNHTSYKGFGRIKYSSVDTKLIRGEAVISPIKIKKLKQEGITQIIDLRNSAQTKSFIEKMVCNIIGIKYTNFRFSHRINELPKDDFFEKINNSITSNDGKSYIHCQYGHHRTGLAVAIYEKLHTGKSDSEIVENLINNGYKEINSTGKTHKEKKYLNLFKQLQKRYLSK